MLYYPAAVGTSGVLLSWMQKHTESQKDTYQYEVGWMGGSTVFNMNTVDTSRYNSSNRRLMKMLHI